MATTYEKIQSTTLGSPTSSITFSSITSAYTDLRLVLVAKDTTGDYPYLRLNSDSGSNYSLTRLQGDGASATSSRQTNQTEAFLINGSLTTTIPVLIELDFFSYAGSTFKTFLNSYSGDYNGSGYAIRMVHLWRSTSAINNINIFVSSGNFATGTTATLYGILRA